MALYGAYWTLLEEDGWLPGTDYSRCALTPSGSPWRAIAGAARRRRTGLSMSAVRIGCDRSDDAVGLKCNFRELGSPGRIRTADQRINSSIQSLLSKNEQERASGKTITYLRCALAQSCSFLSAR